MYIVLMGKNAFNEHFAPLLWRWRKRERERAETVLRVKKFTYFPSSMSELYQEKKSIQDCIF